MRYLIIESPTRGIFTEFNFDTNKPRFRWSIYRTDQAAQAFYTEKAVLKEFARWNDTRLVQSCKVLVIENGRVYENVPQPHLKAPVRRSA